MQVRQTELHHFLCLDRLDDARLDRAKQDFDRLRGEPMLPVKNADTDQVRAQIDAAVATLIASNEAERTALLRTFNERRGQLCLEPQVKGPDPRPTKEKQAKINR